MSIDPRTPVLIGVGQCVRHWAGAADGDAPSPQRLRADAAQAALNDSGMAEAVRASIDRVIVVRQMLDSVPGLPQPFGRCANPPGTLAADLALTPRDTILSAVGGDQPQALVNESAAAIFAGAARTILLSGCEPTAAMKTAARHGITLDWSRSAPGDCDDRGLNFKLLSAYDIANGLGAPTQTYPAFEQALRGRLGHSIAQHRAMMSELWAGFSHVAAANPYAQFPIKRDTAFLSTPSAANYPVADPYLKWDVAQDAVNHGAALILTSVAEADRLGIAAGKRIYLHGYADAHDAMPSERADLSRSAAMVATLDLALRSSGLTAAGISYFDLYSCFPVAVLLAAEALAVGWQARADGASTLTVTGGLPFFGGAGNNYSMHAIATMAERLRADPARYGLILANGGFLSKESVGVYSAQPRVNWQPVSSAAIQADIDALPSPRLLSEDCTGAVESYSVIYAKGVPTRGYAFIRTSDGARALARVAAGEAAQFAAWVAHADPLGRTLAVRHAGGVNIIAL